MRGGEAGRSRGGGGLPATRTRRTTVAAERAALLLDLGMAEASVGHADWPEHLQSAVDTASNAAAAAEAALVLAHALSSAHRFGKAVEVLDRAAGALDARDSELALALEAAAVVAEPSDLFRHLRPPFVVRPCATALRTSRAHHRSC